MKVGSYLVGSSKNNGQFYSLGLLPGSGLENRVTFLNEI
jgi:hypothetical protein